MDESTLYVNICEPVYHNGEKKFNIILEGRNETLYLASTSTQTIDVKDYSIQFDYYQTISDKIQSHIFVECSDDPETKIVGFDFVDQEPFVFVFFYLSFQFIFFE